MAGNISVTHEKLPGNLYEVGLLTLEDSKNYNLKFVSDLKLSDEMIRTTLEELCNCFVESIKRVTKYKRKRGVVLKDRGAIVLGAYRLNGMDVRTNTLFFPLVKQKYSTDVGKFENQLKVLFGSEFKIDNYGIR